MKKKAGSNNQSIEQLLKSRLFGINSNLDVKHYATTENYRHEFDYRLVLTFKGNNILDLDAIDRSYYTSKRLNKREREERDEYVDRLISRLVITQKKG